MNKYLSKYLFYYPSTYLRGERISGHLEQYEKNQWFQSGELKNYQLDNCNKLLDYAFKKFPFYRDSFNRNNLESFSLGELQDLGKLPFLTKSDISKLYQQQSFFGRQFYSKKTTGGSTGQAVTILKNADAMARERAATWRSYRWAGVDIGDPQARYWGVPISTRNRLFYNLVDFIANRKRLSAFNVNAESMEKHYYEMERLKPRYLYGYVSIIREFAEFLTNNSFSLPTSVISIITTSEVLDDDSRTKIESVTGLRIYNEYGCGEVGSIAHECEHGEMHLVADNQIIEIIDEEGKPATTGEIVVTDLFNYAMPLIRYRLGDYATLSEKKCPCGRGLPLIEKIHGRAYDMIVDSTGSRYHPEIILYIFEEIKERNNDIKGFQVVQKDKSNLLINLVITTDKHKMENEEFVKNRVRKNIDDNYNFEFVYLPSIEREKSGKLRLVKSELKT
ncbi:MAG: hypothetical protein GKR93_10605 [Gammaproteobacteria bacterium]|nr:hypothetical protein [Gammaproteobacteria bacterium]